MKGYKHLSDQQRSQVVSVYAETQSTRLTADRLGLQIQRVRFVVKKMGLELTSRRVGACDIHRETVLELARRNEHLSKIARVVGTSKGRVKAWLLREGVPLPIYDQSGEKNAHWKGGRTLDKSGYVLVLKPEHPDADAHGRVREHRLVMERILGRRLLATEVVHHKDEDPSNNDPANLEIFDTNADHLRETRAGQTPDWTEDGLARMRSGVARSANLRRKSSRTALEPDDVALPRRSDRQRSSLDKEPPCP